MRNELIELLNNGEYAYRAIRPSLEMTNTRGLWKGTMSILIDGQETIHGNALGIVIEWLQLGATGKTVAEDITIKAHGFTTRVQPGQFWEELRKHI